MKSNKKNFTLPVQLHIKPRILDFKQEEFNEVENNPYWKYMTNFDKAFINRPYGGFWTSSYDETFGSDWVQWNLNNFIGGAYPTGVICDSYLMFPKEDIRIYVLDDYNDLEKLMYRFRRSLPTNKSKKIPYLDFERISKQYDALHLTKNGQVLLENTEPYHLRNWDCESTLWFHFHSVGKIQHMGKINYPKKNKELVNC